MIKFDTYIILIINFLHRMILKLNFYGDFIPLYFFILNLIFILLIILFFAWKCFKINVLFSISYFNIQFVRN